MYLRRLEVSGFKTFADETRLEYGLGITGIVGPNGSGKSNLTDALRFCLGEQNPRVLRGSRMEEMIFAGSRTRRQVGIAEVTAVFDNADGYFPLDFAEIAVTRKLYRGGDTQYLINKAPCRLKDIHELFMGTGLGHGAIAILGQREIQMVLSQDAQERKLILEEAAGILKYKSRKKEALRRLEVTRDNIVRLRDIAREVETNLATAAEQLEQYHAYMQAQSRLRALSKDLIIWETHDLRQQKTALIRKGADDEEKLASLTDQVERANEALELAKQAEASHQEERDQIRDRLGELTVDIERISGRGALLEERERSLLRDRETRRQALEAVVVRSEALETEASQLAERRAVLEAECQAAAEDLDRRRDEERRIHGLLQQDMPRHAEAEQRLQNLQRSRAVIRERLNSLDERCARADSRLQEIAAQRQKLEDDEAGFSKVMQGHQHETKAIYDRVKAEEAELARLRGIRVKMDADVEKVSRRYETVEDQYHQKSSRLAALRDLESEMAGHGQGVRLILAEPAKFPGVLGLVSDLIHVKHGQETAFEAALASHLSDLITESTEDARRCIDFLKASRAGRVTFWPLDLRRKKEHGKPYLPGLPGIVGWAPELVGYDARFEPVVQALLGRTVVMEDLPSAVKVYDVLVKEARFVPTLVTLDGELMAAGGSISGGFNKTGRHGLLSRKREQHDLEETTVNLKNEFATLKERRKTLDNELKALRVKGDEVRNRLLEAQREASEADSRVAGVRARVNSLVEERARLAKEELHAQEDKAQAAESRVRLQTDLQNLDQEEAKVAEVVRELGGERERLRRERDRISEELQEHRVRWARLSQSLQELDAALTQTAPRREELEAEQERLRHSLEEAVRALRELDRDREQWEGDTVRLDRERQAMQDRLTQAERESEGLAGSVQKLRDETEGLRGRYAGLHEKVQVRRVQLSAMDEKIEASLARLSELELSAEDVDWDAVEPGDRIRVRREQAEAAQQLKSFGPVNLGAVEDYERLQERSDFLKSQLGDLQAAQADISKAILEMDETSSKALARTYQEVNRHFSELFVRLFRGGKAYLELTDPQNLLNTGVEIIAQPPGKRLQNLALLSSGERAITAIAFLLATLKVRPSPFVVLDELDAPLDDANVERVAELLLEFAEKSQFLIITHNRKTMEYASVLYGVTMVEPGTSEVVAVNLEEAGKRVEQAPAA